MYINIWFIGPTNCFTKTARPLYDMKLRCYFHSTEKELMHIKLKWIGGTAEQKRPPVCSTSLPVSQCPWSIFVFVSPLTNSKCTVSFLQPPLKFIPFTRQVACLMMAGKQISTKYVSYFLLPYTKLLVSHFPLFCLVDFLFMYIVIKRITKDTHLPNTSNYDYISTSRTMQTLVRVSFYSRASLCDELSMEMMLSD